MSVDSCIEFFQGLNDTRIYVGRETLVSVVNTVEGSDFAAAINRGTCYTNLSDQYEAATLCIAMISCEGYRLSNRTCPSIPDTTFAVLWSKITSVVEHTSSRVELMHLIKGRNEQGYKSAMNVEAYQDSGILCRTSREELITRQSNIDAMHGTEVIGYLGINVEASQQCGYFRSITGALCHVVGAPQVFTGIYDSVICNHGSKCTVTDICSHKTFTLCMLCGATYCGTVSVALQYQQVLLSDEQVSNPVTSLDKEHYLPHAARSQWYRFSREILSSMLSPRNIVNRGCILIGSIETDKCIYCIWFVRPTIAYSTWSYISAIGKVGSLESTIESMYARWRPYTKKEIQLSISDKSQRPIVKVSGTMSSIYHDNVRISTNQVSYCSSVSFACSTLRIQVIDNRQATVNIRDVMCTQRLLSCLLPCQHKESFSVTHGSSCASLKMHKERIANPGGARITIGKNGGMQYIGRMNQVCDSYLVLCRIMRENMSTKEFRKHLSRSHIMKTHSFPDGISRTRQP